jgi:hypothetical protein
MARGLAGGERGAQTRAKSKSAAAAGTPLLLLFASPHARPKLALLVACAVLLRLLVGLSSYSGAGTPPKYGDFEAQRHWMEIALHTPVATWYTDGPYNNVAYWPLDYPPLSGYQVAFGLCCCCVRRLVTFRVLAFVGGRVGGSVVSV